PAPDQLAGRRRGDRNPGRSSVRPRYRRSVPRRPAGPPRHLPRPGGGVNAEEPTTVRTGSPGRQLRTAPRPAERSTPDSTDPFAGDDDPWAPEDLEGAWVEDARAGAAASIGFLRALFLV